MKPDLALSAAIMALGLTSQAAERPNVVLIMADDVGYECFGRYGSKEYKTPVLDKLAKSGIRFDHCYSQPICTPSRVKIMTGRSNVRNYHDFSILHPREKTFGHMMQNAGYETCIAGKWQLYGAKHYGKMAGKGTLPKDAGFDDYCLWQIKELGSRFWKPKINVNGTLKEYGKDVYGPDVFVAHINDFIETNKDKPFFIYYPMVLVHNPFDPTPDSLDRKSRNKKRNFVDMVHYMDTCIGKIVDQLERSGVRKNTLVIFTGDNGTNVAISSMLNGVKIRGGKGKTTDAGTREPLIANWPGVIPEGGVCGDLVDFNDFMPTIAEATGAAMPTDRTLDGISFLPQLKGRKGTPRQWTYCYYNPRPTRKSRFKEVRFVRDKRWKLYGDGRLFDVSKDVLEKRPITIETEAAKTAREKLQKAMDTMPKKPQALNSM